MVKCYFVKEFFVNVCKLVRYHAVVLINKSLLMITDDNYSFCFGCKNTKVYRYLRVSEVSVLLIVDAG